MIITLPWPPSVNHYWIMSGNRMVLSPKGRAYRANAVAAVVEQHGLLVPLALDVRVYVSIDAHPPDKRRHDLDNILKGVLDSLRYARVYEDDSQVDELSVYRCNVVPKGTLNILVGESHGERP